MKKLLLIALFMSTAHAETLSPFEAKQAAMNLCQGVATAYSLAAVARDSFQPQKSAYSLLHSQMRHVLSDGMMRYVVRNVYTNPSLIPYTSLNIGDLAYGECMKSVESQ